MTEFPPPERPSRTPTQPPHSAVEREKSQSALTLVVAMSRNRVIGKDGGIPWRLPEDMKHFRRVTMGHAIVMGRRTHESIGKALPGRRNIVITRRANYSAEGCEVAHDLDEALRRARAHDPDPRLIGGGELYAQALPLATRIYLTELERDVEGDTFFPELDAHEWREVERHETGEAVYRTLERAASRA